MTARTSLDGERALEMYRRMRLIRRFEERIVELVNANEIPGVTHEYVGQEAVAVGACLALTASDVITSTHRGHGHLIAKGGDVGRMFAELMGKQTGYNHGRGGSMHIADVSLGIFGANGIVGAGAPIACGAAYAFQTRGEPNVAVAFFGDGAMNQGVLHESLNLAAIWRLPVVFVCENNGYAMTTPVTSTTRTELWRRGESYGMPAEVVDGMDVELVYAAAERAVARARNGGGPSFIEATTYRYFGHFTAERLLKLSYRTEAEIATWRARDPLDKQAARLTAAGAWSPEGRAAIDAAVERDLAAGIELARSGSLPSVDAVLEYVYAVPYPGLPARGFEE